MPRRTPSHRTRNVRVVPSPPVVDQPITRATQRAEEAMGDVWDKAEDFYTQHIPPFEAATDADIDAAPLPPETRDKLKRCILLRDQINHYLSWRDNAYVWSGAETIDPDHKELIEEVRKVLNAGPVEIK